MSEVHDARDILTFESRDILFDTNVWLSIYAYPGQYRQAEQRGYSALLKHAKANDCTIYTNDYVLAEFVNRYMKLEYDGLVSDAQQQGLTLPHFKKYRSSTGFKASMEIVRDTYEYILEDCRYVSVNAACDMRKVCDEVCGGMIDFSDVILREHCWANSYMVATNDADFSACGLDIVTCNPGLPPEKWSSLK